MGVGVPGPDLAFGICLDDGYGNIRRGGGKPSYNITSFAFAEWFRINSGRGKRPASLRHQLWGIGP